jgi:hypothetical protein
MEIAELAFRDQMILLRKIKVTQLKLRYQSGLCPQV